MPSILRDSSTEAELTEQQAADLRIHELAGRIKDEKQLRAILVTTVLGLRRGVYNKLVPHLSFKPRTFRKLMR